MKDENQSYFNEGGFKLALFGKSRNAIKSRIANELIRALNALGKIKIQYGKEGKVLYSDSSVIIQLRKPVFEQVVSGEVGVYRAKIKVLQKNYVECAIWDGTAFPESGFINVAKPFSLRHIASDTVHGVSVSYTYPTGGTAFNDTNTRTAAAGGYDNETHKVILPYEVNREILVMNTGLPVGTETGLSAVTYIDMNIDARTWSSVPALPIQ